MPLFLPVFITRAAGWGMADSVIAIPAIPHEHFLPVLGSRFPKGLIPRSSIAKPCVWSMEREEAMVEPWERPGTH